MVYSRSLCLKKGRDKNFRATEADLQRCNTQISDLVEKRNYIRGGTLKTFSDRGKKKYFSYLKVPLQY